jgi:acetylornithine/N-succinyldiaminopimelate aminotransferase
MAKSCKQPQVKYAKKLTSFLPENLNTVFFTNSGAEATEGAMKLAKRITGRTKFIYFKNSYHGSTQGALSLMGDEYYKQAFRPLLPDTEALHYGDESELAKIDERVAAVFIEPVQAESGVSVPSVSYMQALANQCKKMGVLWVADEAQTGFGRTGRLWGFENFGIVPDILLLAKAIGGGLPLGAFISSYQNMQLLTHNPVLGHITSFGGHPVSCAAGLTAFDFLIESNLIAEVEKKGALFQEKLQHPAIKSFRRKGLMMAIQFASAEINQRIVHTAVANGLITDWFLFAPDCLRICPPLIITDDEIKKACTLLLKVIDNH